MTTEERLLKLENAVVTLSELAAKSDARTSDLDRYFRMLTELTVHADDRMDEFDKRLSALAEAQERTESNLNILVNTVERYISEGRNGQS